MKRLSAILLCAALVSGCNDARRDATDEKDPYVRKGLEQMQIKHWNNAIEQFETALGKNPLLARPDLELALIYHQQSKNYIRAIYHYERYLEKRPASEKRPLIDGWIRQAKISLAAEIGQASGDISEELIRLTRENNLLRQQIEKAVEAGPAAPAKPVVVQPPVKKPDPTPVSAAPVERIQIPPPTPDTYNVLPGDTLTRIAKTVYGDSSKWRQIYEANLDSMASENDLKAGQTIRIPTPGN
ncbi:MAG: LysM peptidoglycan-binding domain-containing protein [Verrucomicrobia bacterium]|nr:LysM peptidoglycan-binding domain-containing protein [Verrucomicrobiota bacterium]